MTLRLRYLLTGTGHCGTGWAARLLTSAGVVCGHEHVFTFGGYRLREPPWGYPWSLVQADASWQAAGYLEHPCLDEATVVHLVRNPLHVTRSWLATHDPAHGPTIYVQRWLAWNLWIEERCRVLGRPRVPFLVHDGAEALLGRLSIAVPGSYENDTRYNTHRGDDAPAVRMDDILEDTAAVLRAYCEPRGIPYDDAV